jgi:hypothetical protein
MMRRRWLLAITIADIVVFGGIIGREVMARERGAAVRLAVTGYDPRDLVSGHYVRFRLVAEREADALSTTADEFCLTEDAGRHHVTGARHDDCDLFLRRRDGDFGVDRFYVDERKADEVAFIPNDADAYITAFVTKDGVIHVTNLFVNGRALH